MKRIPQVSLRCYGGKYFSSYSPPLPLKCHILNFLPCGFQQNQGQRFHGFRHRVLVLWPLLWHNGERLCRDLLRLHGFYYRGKCCFYSLQPFMAHGEMVSSYTTFVFIFRNWLIFFGSLSPVTLWILLASKIVFAN